MIHFKPKHHQLVTDLGFIQNKSGYYRSRLMSAPKRTEIEQTLIDSGFTKQKSDLNDNLISYKHQEYPDLEIHFRKIDPIVHQAYISSKNHEPSITEPEQRRLI